MTSEKILLDQWRRLPPEQQKAALEFVEFLHSKAAKPAHSSLETELQQLRAEIAASGELLLQTWEEVEQEVLDRRGGIDVQEMAVSSIAG